MFKFKWDGSGGEPVYVDLEKPGEPTFRDVKDELEKDYQLPKFEDWIIHKTTAEDDDVDQSTPLVAGEVYDLTRPAEPVPVLVLFFFLRIFHA